MMSDSIVISATNATDLDPAPIAPSWILSGTPEARAKVMAKSKDNTSYIMVWECTPGQFNWHYSDDETVVLLSGEVFISNGKGPERRLSAGEMAFFPAGSSCTWRITDRVRKVAVLRNALPRPLGLGLRAWNKFLRMIGLKAHSPLMLPLVAAAQLAP
jgi:uncharacterized cupin superfamily protein